MNYSSQHRAKAARSNTGHALTGGIRTYRFRKVLVTSLVASFVVLALVLAGCDTTSASSEHGDPSAQVINVGTAGRPSPYGWIEADGSLGGYDQAVLKEISALLPQYRFEPEIIDFAAIFSGLDSNRYQMAANNFSYTEERANKYYFSEENYIHNTIAVAHKKGRSDINDASDLGGKSVVTSNDGVAFQLYLEAYNEANPQNPISISYSDQDMLINLTQVQNGAIDFDVCELAILNYYKDEFDIELDSFVLDTEDTYGLLDMESYYIFPKTEQGDQLRKDVDGAIKTLKENGVLSSLSQDYFGFDMFSSEYDK